MSFIYFVNNFFLIIILILLSIFSLSLFLERLFHFRWLFKEHKNFYKFYLSFLKDKKKDFIAESKKISYPFKDDFIYLIDEKNDKQKKKENLITFFKVNKISLNKEVEVIGLIAYISPLIGILGTVLAIIYVLQEIKSKDEFIIMQGLWQALSTTALGLIVSIHSYAFYYYLSLKVEKIIQKLTQDIFFLINYPDKL